MSKQCYIHLMEFYSAIKKNKILINVTAWMNFQKRWASERSQMETATYRVIPFYRKCLEKENLLRQKADLQLLRVGIKSRLTVNRPKGTVGDDRNVLKLDWVGHCTTLNLLKLSKCSLRMDEFYSMHTVPP